MKRHQQNKSIEENLPPVKFKQQGVAIIAVHGRNQAADFMLDVLNRAGWDKLAVVLPEADDASWYPEKFMEPIEKNAADLQDALDLIRDKHHQLKLLGFNDDQIVLIGFSQGACLLSQYALSFPAKFRAIYLLTGGFIGPQDFEWDFSGDFKQTPVYITTAENDEWVPPSRVLETADTFKALNAKVTAKIFKDRPHEISPEEIEMLKELVY